MFIYLNFFVLKTVLLPWRLILSRIDVKVVDDIFRNNLLDNDVDIIRYKARLTTNVTKLNFTFF